MSSLLTTSIGHQLSNHFFLKESNSTQPDLQSSYGVSDGDQLTVSPLCTVSNQHGTNHVSKRSKLEFEELFTSNLSETHLPGVFAASPVSTSQNDPTAAASLPIVAAKTCQVTSISGDASEVLRVHSIGSNRESSKLLKRCKRRLTRLSRPWFRRDQKIKRPRAQFRSTDRDPPVPVDTKHSSCHCPSGSILQDLQNQYSSLSVELHGIKTQLTDLQQACTSIHSLLLRLQPNPIPLTTIVCGTANPTALGTFPSVIYPAPVPTAVVQNPTKNMNSDVLYPQSAYPSSLSVCPPKLTQITVHTNLFDGSTKTTTSSISATVQRESARSEPLQSGIRGVPTPSVSSYVSSPMFSDCGSSVSSASTPQLSLDDGIPDSSFKLTTKQTQRAHQSTAGFILTGSTENLTTTSSSSAHSSTSSSSSCSISHTSTSITTTTTSMTLANDLNSISGTTDTVDTMELVQRLRTLLTTHGLSQRQLAKILPGCSQRFIRDLLARPRPWSRLTDKRRLVYRHLRLWLDDPANVAKLSSDQTDPSPLVTHDSAHSEQKAHGTTTNTSCSAFSLGPSDSTLEISVPGKERRRSTSSHADSVSLFSGSCSSSTRTGESRKPSGENDQQTEKRIADILSAARIAMAQEECEKTQRSDVVRCASNQDTKSSEDLDLNPNDPINPSLQSEIVGGESSAPVGEVHQSTTINPEASLPLTSSINVRSVTTVTSSLAQASETIVTNNSTNLPLVLPPLGVPTPASTDELPGLLQFILSQSCTGLNPVQSAASTSVPAVPPVNNSLNQPSSDVGNPVHTKPTVTASDDSSLSVSAVAPASRSSELGLTREIVSQLSGNALNPLSQTLLLLTQTVTPQSQSVPNNALSVEVIGSNVENNLPNFSPGALPKSSTDTQLPGVDAPLFTALQPPPLGNILSSMTFAGMPPQKPDSPPTYSSQNQSANANGSIETDPTSRIAPTNLYQRPSTDEVVQVAKKLDDLDTDSLRARVKDVLRQNGVSQRLFGEVILGMCQASVSDMLSKPRAWSQLTEKARLPYVRMHMWLNQPDGLDALRGAAASANNVPKHGLRSQTQSVSSNCDVELPVSTQTIMSTKPEYEFRKRERSAHTPNHSPVGTPVKLTKVEPASSTAPTDPLDCLDQSLSDSDRQSLVDIAKAATLAMKRACCVGSNNLKVRGQGDQPSSVPGTPTKRDVLVNQPPKIVPRPANRFDLNRASHPIDSSFLGRNRVVFSPAQKQALLAEFTRQPYPSSSSLRALARDLNLPYKPVVNWFHNRRMRSRQRVPFSVSTQDETTANIIRDLASDSTLPELPDRECNENLLVQAYFTPTDETPPVGDCATFASSGSQANRRKRPDPTRLIAESGTAITPSE